MSYANRSLLSRVIGMALSTVPASYVEPARSHGPGEVIAEPARMGAKPTRYRPSPSNPPQSGKRRRQWR